MKKTSLLKRFKIKQELEKHDKDHHGQIKYTKYTEAGTDKILKQDFACVCGKKWEIDYGLSEMEEKGEITHTETIHYDWKPEKFRDKES